MSYLRLIYLVLVIIGGIKPMMHFLAWFNEYGYSWVGIVAAWTVNEASRGLMWDLTISACVLTIWMASEVYVRKDWWVFVVCFIATFGIGVSCGLPLYLFLRSRTFK
jgi:hypothetical protein|tara:strand:- start:801 stop:1121 length:321 start_codon:yes stop_codon:yes gene_type:complete